MLDKYSLIVCMREILIHPIKRYSVRNLAKETKLSVFASKSALDYMYAKGMLFREVIGRTYQYKVNRDDFIVRQWKMLFSMETLKKEEILVKLLKSVRNISSVLVYGSVASGTDDEKSDIDILVIADTKEKTGAYGLYSVGGRELNIQVYTPMEWRRKAEKDKIFYEQVMFNSIMLYGSKPAVL